MNYTREEINLITLDSIGGLSYIQKRTLLSDFSSAEPDFKKYDKILIKSLSGGVYNKVREDFDSETFRTAAVKKLSDGGVECVTYFSDAYPEALKNTDRPPVVLYCKGNIKLLGTDCFSVVGSRRTPPRALNLCKKIAGELTEHFTVVSGMADGADTAALEGAAESGKVISVLANGLDRIYPAVNASLAQKIIKRGLVITEYSPEVLPRRHQFPVRNRIIAGLSRGTLIVSAGRKSGAMITAEYAEEYGRDLFAFPYAAGDEAGAGCNFLIKNKAKLVENTLDIFASYGLDFKPQAEVGLSEEEEKLLSAIRELGEAFIADIAAKLGVLPYMLIASVSKLEIKGLVVRIGGNRFSAV